MSVVSIKDTFYLRFQIEDVDLDAMNATFNSISIIESAGQTAPVVRITLYDSSRTYSHENSLVEGTKISIEMAKGPEGLNGAYYTGDYRLFGSKNNESPFSGHLWNLVFLLDIPKYTIKASTEAYSDDDKPIMSCEAMKRIADKSGLIYDKDSLSFTNDRQRWLCVAQTRSAMAEYIAARGYISPKSCTVHGITANKVLVYKDIIQQSLEATPKATFLHNADKNTDLAYPPLYWVREAKTVSSSGILNAWANYGYTHIQHSLKGKPVIIDKMSATATGKYLAINKDVKEVIDGDARVYYSDLMDTGHGFSNDASNNLHANIVEAYYQNLRYKLLFSQTVHVLIENQTTLKLYDEVMYIQQDAVNGKYVINPRNTGKYIIVSKTIYGKAGSNYYEKFVIARSHTTQSGRSNLLG